MSAAAYKYLYDLVYRRTGIVLSTGKEYLVLSRLQSTMEELGVQNVEGLVARLRATHGTVLESRIADLMTTNETFFFRDPATFESIRRQVIPELIKKKQRQRRIWIWSAACSTGPLAQRGSSSAST